MGLGTDQGTLGDSRLWLSERHVVGGGHHADSDGRVGTVGTVGDPAIPREADIRLDDLDGSGGSGDISASELAGVVWVRGLSLPEYLASFVTIPGLVSLLMFLLFAAMPMIVTRAGRRGVGELS